MLFPYPPLKKYITEKGIVVVRFFFRQSSNVGIYNFKRNQPIITSELRFEIQITGTCSLLKLQSENSTKISNNYYILQNKILQTLFVSYSNYNTGYITKHSSCYCAFNATAYRLRDLNGAIAAKVMFTGNTRSKCYNIKLLLNSCCLEPNNCKCDYVEFCYVVILPISLNFDLSFHCVWREPILINLMYKNCIN